MYLRFVFLLITRAASWLQLAQRPGSADDHSRTDQPCAAPELVATSDLLGCLASDAVSRWQASAARVTRCRPGAPIARAVHAGSAKRTPAARSDAGRRPHSTPTIPTDHRPHQPPSSDHPATMSRSSCRLAHPVVPMLECFKRLTWPRPAGSSLVPGVLVAAAGAAAETATRVSCEAVLAVAEVVLIASGVHRWAVAGRGEQNGGQPVRHRDGLQALASLSAPGRWPSHSA
jgi:hypothetical protein